MQASGGKSPAVHRPLTPAPPITATHIEDMQTNAAFIAFNMSLEALIDAALRRIVGLQRSSKWIEHTACSASAQCRYRAFKGERRIPPASTLAGEWFARVSLKAYAGRKWDERVACSDAVALLHSTCQVRPGADAIRC